LNEYVQEHGPFYGILGYSQGSMFVPYYLSAAPASIANSFQMALLFCGYLPTTHLGLLGSINAQSPFNGIPVLVYMGVNDFVISNAMTEAQASKFASPVVLRSNVGGHELPSSSDPMFAAMLSFLRDPLAPAPTTTSGGATTTPSTTSWDACPGVCYAGVCYIGKTPDYAVACPADADGDKETTSDGKDSETGGKDDTYNGKDDMGYDKDDMDYGKNDNYNGKDDTYHGSGGATTTPSTTSWDACPGVCYGGVCYIGKTPDYAVACPADADGDKETTSDGKDSETGGKDDTYNGKDDMGYDKDDMDYGKNDDYNGKDDTHHGKDDMDNGKDTSITAETTACSLTSGVGNGVAFDTGYVDIAQLPCTYEDVSLALCSDPGCLYPVALQIGDATVPVPPWPMQLNPGGDHFQWVPRESCAVQGCTDLDWSTNQGQACVTGAQPGGMSCYCDDACTNYKDCCYDYHSVCKTSRKVAYDSAELAETVMSKEF